MAFSSLVGIFPSLFLFSHIKMYPISYFQSALPRIGQPLWQINCVKIFLDEIGIKLLPVKMPAKWLLITSLRRNNLIAEIFRCHCKIVQELFCGQAGLSDPLRADFSCNINHRPKPRWKWNQVFRRRLRVCMCINKPVYKSVWDKNCTQIPTKFHI